MTQITTDNFYIYFLLEKFTIKNAWPYQKDKMTLPVKNVEEAIPFYEKIMGFQVVSKKSRPHKAVIMERNEIQIGLEENGGDPTQDGCFFEVNSVEKAIEELKQNGLVKENYNTDLHKHGDTSWKVFFVVAPDGLCYCLGEAQD